MVATNRFHCITIVSLKGSGAHAWLTWKYCRQCGSCVSLRMDNCLKGAFRKCEKWNSCCLYVFSTDISDPWSFDIVWMGICLFRQCQQWPTCRPLCQSTSIMPTIYSRIPPHQLSNWSKKASISSIRICMKIFCLYLSKYAKRQQYSTMNVSSWPNKIPEWLN